MATSVGAASDGYFQDVTLNADGSVSFVYMPTVPGGLPSPMSYTAQQFQDTINLTAALVINNQHPQNGYLAPISALALDVAVQQGKITATQYQTWLAGGDMPIGGIKGFTAYDYDPVTSGPIPSFTQIATSPTLMGSLNTSDVRTVNTVLQVTTKIESAAKNLPTLTGNQVTVEKMYLAAFLRAPEKSGLDFWVNLLDSGKTVTEIGDVIFSLPGVQEIYSLTMSNTQFVTAIYDNVFGRAPDDDGLAYWLNRMDGGEHRGDLVLSMMDAGLGTAIGTPGRDYVMNRYDTVHYAVQNQVKAGAEISRDTLLDMTSKVGADATGITVYQQGIDAQLASIVGTQAMSSEHVFG